MSLSEFGAVSVLDFSHYNRCVVVCLFFFFLINFFKNLFWLRRVFVAVRGLLIAVASPVVERGLQSTGSAVVAPGPSCSAACGILPDQGSNPCAPAWQADSQPLHHQERPAILF